jgi:hypothetical protein
MSTALAKVAAKLGGKKSKFDGLKDLLKEHKGKIAAGAGAAAAAGGLSELLGEDEDEPKTRKRGKRGTFQRDDEDDGY